MLFDSNTLDLGLYNTYYISTTWLQINIYKERP